MLCHTKFSMITNSKCQWHIWELRDKRGNDSIMCVLVRDCKLEFTTSVTRDSSFEIELDISRLRKFTTTREDRRASRCIEYVGTQVRLPSAPFTDFDKVLYLKQRHVMSRSRRYEEISSWFYRDLSTFAECDIVIASQKDTRASLSPSLPFFPRSPQDFPTRLNFPAQWTHI